MISSAYCFGHRHRPAIPATSLNKDTVLPWWDLYLDSRKPYEAEFRKIQIHVAYPNQEELCNFTIDGDTATKVLGVWIGEDPSNWDINTKQIMKRTYASMSVCQYASMSVCQYASISVCQYASMSVLTKLKYAGLSRDKLLHIYALHIRSSVEYCSVVWHLTQAQSNAMKGSRL